MVRALAQATLLACMVCSPLADSGYCYAQQKPAHSVQLSLISDEFDLPVHITSNPFRPDEIVIVERDGLAKSISKKDHLIREVLDIEDLINENHRHGLMSVSYSNQSEGGAGELFANYIDTQGDLVVARFPDRGGKLADEQQMSVVIKVAQISANSNGSQIQTRLDNSLLISTGDGGDAPANNPSAAQSPRSLLGKVLQVIPKGTGGYAAPAAKSTANDKAPLPEIWASGFHNPEYLSVDSATGDVFVIDNSTTYLEINAVQSSKNYGWDQVEGNTCLKSGCNTAAYSAPSLTLQKTSANARLIGGVVYRGKNITELEGRFIFAETSSATIFAAELGSDKTWRYSPIATIPKKEITAIGQDASGEVYVATRDGSLFLIASAADRKQ